MFGERGLYRYTRLRFPESECRNLARERLVPMNAGGRFVCIDLFAINIDEVESLSSRILLMPYLISITRFNKASTSIADPNAAYSTPRQLRNETGSGL
jgi:hypothetical protein